MSFQKFENAINTWLPKRPSNTLFFYWKGRVALFAILKAMGVGHGDEVVLQGFTCVVVPNAILYLGATPIYVDVDETYTAPKEHFLKAITPKTKVVIIQNSFGFSRDVKEIADWCRQKGIYTIEDGTHGFGGTYNDAFNGAYTDAIFYSSQWNKPFSTGLGGFSFVRSLALEKKLFEMDESKLKPSLLEVINLRVLICLKSLFLNDMTYWRVLKLFRFFSRLPFFLGSSTAEELESVQMPRAFFKGMSNMQAKVGIRQLKQFAGALNMRKKNGVIYTEFLKNSKKTYVNPSCFSNHSFLTYPLLVKNKRLFFKKAEQHRIRLGDWFASPIHPVNTNLSQWQCHQHNLPNAMYYSQHIVNLPTDLNNPSRVIQFLQEHLDEIL